MSTILKCDAPDCRKTIPAHEEGAEDWWKAEARWSSATKNLRGRSWEGEVHGCSLDHLAAAIAVDITSVEEPSS